MNLVDIFRSELHDLADSVVVDAVNDRDDQCDLDADAGEIFDRLLFHIEQIANTAVLVLLFSDTIELKIDAVLTRSLSGFAEFNVFSKTNPIRRGENAVEANLLSIGNRFQIVRRKRRLAAGEKNNDLASRLE